MIRSLSAVAVAFFVAACSQGISKDAVPLPETEFSAFLTGYSYWDNTPPGSAAIARPVIHREAGGVGTYEDPITLAVGHVIEPFKHTMDYPAGTRFYFPRIRKYAVVEDLCGDGRRPQDGPCHSGHKGHPWLDIYVGGKKTTAKHAEWCMRKITGVQRATMNPKPGYPVVPGEIVMTDCKTF